MRIILPISLAFALVAFAAPVSAQSSTGGAEARGTVRPSPDTFDYYLRMRDGAFAAWASEEDARFVSQNYRMALRFAECVARFNRGTASRMLVASIAGRDDGVGLRRMAQANQGCATEHSKVHPLLLRAALAETLIEKKSDFTETAPRSGSSVGVPDVVDGYPLGMISRCQVKFAPELVAELLSTVPGDRAERDAAESLFGKTPACGTTKLGRLSATAARLALIDAAYRASSKDRAAP